MARDDAPASSTASSTKAVLLAAWPLAARRLPVVRGKVGSEFET